MGKGEEQKKAGGGDQMTVVSTYNSCADVKFFVTALLFLCSLATVFQFLPSRLSFSLPQQLPSSLPPPSSCSPTDHPLVLLNNFPSPLPLHQSLPFNPSLPLHHHGYSGATGIPSLPRHQDSPSPPRLPVEDSVSDGMTLRRTFDPYGAAAYSFVLMSAYRGGSSTFVVNGLASKPLHVFGKPTYVCRWVDDERGNHEAVAEGVRYLPDWGYGRVYTVVVVNCTFPVPVGVDGGGGGRLVVEATTNGGGDSRVNVTDTIEALYEAPGSVNVSYFTSPPKYDYLYCGSPLYGDLSPQRVREWIAYHVRFFGEKSHFVIHDAGGIHADVLAVLRPWIEKGYVTLNDVREQERFDGYYHNQFLIVNDCLHRYRFDAKWMFFFDVDEFIFVPKKKTIKSVTDSLLGYTQFTIQQMPMSEKLCLDDGGRTYKKWGFEKLAYRDSRTRIRRDRKYAVQPRNVLATGVHMSENIVGKTTHKTEGQIKYYHYHGTIAQRREPCRQLLNTTDIPLEGIPYVMDTTMRDIGATVKRFELKMIGPILQKTRQ